MSCANDPKVLATIMLLPAAPMKATFAREVLLMKRNSFVYAFKAIQLMIVALITMTLFSGTEKHHDLETDGGVYMVALFFSLVTIMFNAFSELGMTLSKLPVFCKQRDLSFYPSWAYAIPSWILKIPICLVLVAAWVFVTYYVIDHKDPRCN
ncbi:uncharacterized protein A4U43_C08F6750 [Asparagus officinalis]|nr:uncharacterized protein A4U43_C08F6750 [Asparagus officinalis]